MRYGFKRPIVVQNSNHVLRARTKRIGSEARLDSRSLQIDCYRLHQNFKMAMSGIAVSNECVCAHEAQRSKKGVQYTIYKIGDCKDHDDEQQQMKGKKPKQEIVVDRCCDKCFKADDVQDKSAEEVEELGKKVFTDFIDTLPEREPRYAVFDYVWKAQSSGSYNDKLKFISWSPDAAQVKQKMIYSSTKDSLKKKLNISGKDIFLASKNPDDISEAYEKLLKEN